MLGPRNMVPGSLDFRFDSYPRLRSEETSNQETPMAPAKHFPSFRTKKGQPSMRENFQAVIALFQAKHHRNNRGPSPLNSSKGQVGAFTSMLAEAGIRHLSTLTGVVAEKAKQGPRTFILSSSSESSDPCSISGEHPIHTLQLRGVVPPRWRTWTSASTWQ